MSTNELKSGKKMNLEKLESTVLPLLGINELKSGKRQISWFN